MVMDKKSFMAALMISALLFSLAASLRVREVNAEPRTLFVPDDYSTIQMAIGNSSTGDKVFVRAGDYNVVGYDGILIDKPISLIGENSQTTVITVGQYRYGHDVIHITADNVTVSNFTIIANGVAGIDIEDTYDHVPIGCRIIGNKIQGGNWGIITYGSTNTITGTIKYKPSYLTISGNTVTGNSIDGMYISSSNSTISENTITGNSREGVMIDEALYVTVTRNNISNNGGGSDANDKGGLSLGWWGPFYVYGNNITNNNGSGIAFREFCNNSTIWGNNIENNEFGIQEYYVDDGGKGNTV